jgi:peroxiredoxin
MMRPIWITLPAGLAFAGWGALLYMRSQMAFGDQPVVGNLPKHPVTESMREKAEREARKPAPDFRLPDLQGKKWTLAEVQQGTPTFLYFVQNGCPCSVDAEPLFHKLAEHHAGRVTFVAIIDSSPKLAQAWAKQNNTPYLMLCDPSVETMKAYSAPNSVYSVLLDGDGKIVKQWPGYSQRLLADMNETMAKVSRDPVRKFDALYAPKEDSSGCAFSPKKE